MHRILVATLLLACTFMLGAARDIRDSSLETAGALGAAIIDLDHHVALGHIPGAVAVTKFGYNPALTSPTVEESVWDVPGLGGPLLCNTVVTTTPTVLYLSSSDEADAGKVVRIQGTTTDNVAQELDVLLGADNTETGTVFVAAGTWLRVNRMIAILDDLEGDVYLHIDSEDEATVDGIPDTPLTDIVAGITAGENQTLQACYRVPAGFVAVIQQMCMGNATIGGENDVTFRFRGQRGGLATRTLTLYTLGAGDLQCIATVPPRVFPAGIDLSITGAATTQAASATFGFLLLPDSHSYSR